MFDISLVEESIVTVDFEVINPATDEVAGVLTVTYDRNMFSGEYDRRQGKIFAARVRAIEEHIKKRFAPVKTKQLQSAQSRNKKRAQPEENRLVLLANSYQSARETDAMTQDIHREVLAEALACNRCVKDDCPKKTHNDCGLIKSWSAVRNGQSVSPTYEELVRKPLSFLVDLEQFLRSYALPKEVRTLRLRTTSDSTGDTSASVPDTPTAESQIM